MKIKENIFSVGVVDAEVRIFHGYETPMGTTYNAYLIIDEKVTLIDFVKAPFAKQLLENIKGVLGDRDIDYIICNHVEPDHSGALPAVVAQYPKAIIYGTAQCQKGLKAYYPNVSFPFCVVKKGDSLTTGQYTFHFIPMPMVHWPDSMATYLDKEQILFSNDAFGQHIATDKLYDVTIGLETFLERAGDYYANIVLPFDVPVSKVLESAVSIDIKMICPSHGVIVTDFVQNIIDKYFFWSQAKTQDKKMVIVFDTMWGTTKKMAENLYDEYTKKGFDVEMVHLGQRHYSYAMAKLLEAKYIFVGSSTLNNQMLPTVSAFLTYMKGLKPKKRIGKAFGSYGWSGESIVHVHDALSSCGFEMLDPIKVMWNV